MLTRGIRILEQRGVPYEIVEYIYKQKGAERAAKAVGWVEEQVVKSLVIQTGPKEFRFALVPAHRDLSVKKLGRMLGVKKVELASVRDAERLTGYVQGGISPLGSYAALPVIMDESLFEQEQVLVNAGHRGILVSLSPWDIQELLDAAVEDIIT